MTFKKLFLKLILRFWKVAPDPDPQHCFIPIQSREKFPVFEIVCSLATPYCEPLNTALNAAKIEIFRYFLFSVEKPQPTEKVVHSEQQEEVQVPTSEATVEASAPVAEECAPTPVAAESAPPTEPAAAEPEVSAVESSAEVAAPEPEVAVAEEAAPTSPPPAAAAVATAAPSTAAAGSSMRDGVSIDPQSGRVMSAPAARPGRVPPGGHSTLSLW
jgi:hypothetical protein